MHDLERIDRPAARAVIGDGFDEGKVRPGADVDHVLALLLGDAGG